MASAIEFNIHSWKNEEKKNLLWSPAELSEWGAQDKLSFWAEVLLTLKDRISRKENSIWKLLKIFVWKWKDSVRKGDFRLFSNLVISVWFLTLNIHKLCQMVSTVNKINSYKNPTFLVIQLEYAPVQKWWDLIIYYFSTYLKNEYRKRNGILTCLRDLFYFIGVSCLTSRNSKCLQE